MFYIVIGLVGGAVIGLLQAFPRELVLAVAGLALLGTIAGGLAAALQDERHRDAAVLTFLVTLSGVSLAGVGSAFWGVVAGALRSLCNSGGGEPPPKRLVPLPSQMGSTAGGPAKPDPRRLLGTSLCVVPHR